VTVHGCTVRSSLTGYQVTSRPRDQFSRYSKWTDTFRTAYVHFITALDRQSVSIPLHGNVTCGRYVFKMSDAQLDDAIDVEEEILQVHVIL